MYLDPTRSSTLLRYCAPVYFHEFLHVQYMCSYRSCGYKYSNTAVPVQQYTAEGSCTAHDVSGCMAAWANTGRLAVTPSQADSGCDADRTMTAAGKYRLAGNASAGR